MEECALARSTGADNHRKLPLWYVDRDSGQGGDLVFSLLIDFSDVEQAYHAVRVFNQIMAMGKEESRRFPLTPIQKKTRGQIRKNGLAFPALYDLLPGTFVAWRRSTLAAFL